MKTNYTYRLLAFVGIIILHTTAKGQCYNNNIDIRFLNAKFTDTTSGKDLLVVFLVSTKDSASFPPVVTLPPKCTVFENGREKVILLSPSNLQLTTDGNQIAIKNPAVYALIKDQVNLKSMRNSMIVTYKLIDINYDFTRMSLTPAYREKLNQSIKIDKRCEFEVKR